MSDWFRTLDDGLSISVRVTPNAKREGVEGVMARDDGSVALAVRVRKPPEDGAANKAVVAVLAKAFGVAKSRVALASGATSRTKRFTIEGDPADLAARAREIAGGG